MNKLFKSIVCVATGLAMAIGVGVGINKGAQAMYAAEIKDTITASDLAATSTSYTDFSGVSKTSNAVYAGNSAKNGSNIQMRSSGSNSGIVSTTSGGTVKSVKINVASGTKTIDVYGSNTAYTSAANLYATSGNNNQGTKIGSVTSTGTVTFTDDYAYVGIRSNNGAIYLSSIEITWEVQGSGTGGSSSEPGSSSSSDPSSSSSSSSQESNIIEATFAEVMAAGQQLSSGSTSDKYYKFQGYVAKKEGVNYFLTATQNETFAYSNAIELYKAGQVPELVNKLLHGALVEVTMKIKNYNGTIENGPYLVNDDVTVITAGTDWPVISVEISEAITIAEELSNDASSDDLYELTGYIVAITTAWSESNGNLTFNLGATSDATSYITAYRARAAVGTTGSELQQGDKVKVVGNLTNHNGSAQMKEGSTTTFLEAGPNHPVVVDPHAAGVATVKTIAEVKAYQAADNSLIAKVTGIAEHITNTSYGNFHLVDASTGEHIVVYGGYSDTTFQKTGNTYSYKSHSTPITSSIIGHTVTVYGTIGYYDNAGQLTETLVEDGAVATVSVSYEVNDSSMGSVALSATSVTYGTEITVTPTANSGYQVKSVVVQRATTDAVTLTAESNGTYKFSAEAKNLVSVTFEEESSVVPTPASSLTKMASYNFDSNYSGTSKYNDDGLLARFHSDFTSDEGLSDIVTAVSDSANMYPAYTEATSYLGIKFGTSSANGSFTLTLSKAISQIVVKVAGWGTGDSLTIGDADAQTPGVAYNGTDPIKTLTYNITASKNVTFTFAKRGFIQTIDFYADPSTYLSSASSIATIRGTAVVENEQVTAVNSLALRFGAKVSITAWDSVFDAGYEIEEYGIKMFLSNTLTGVPTVESRAAVTNGVISVSKKVTDDGEPDEDGEGNYNFLAVVNIPDDPSGLPKNFSRASYFCVRPFVKIDGKEYFLLSEDMHESIKTLAAHNNGTNLSEAALSFLAA